jgi:hypothetical protein
MEYNGKGDLFITVQYGRWQYATNASGLPINCSNPLLLNLLVRADPYKLEKIDDSIVPVVSMASEDNNTITAGADFECDGTVYFVDSVHNGKVITCQGRVFDSVEEVRNLIGKRLK